MKTIVSSLEYLPHSNFQKRIVSAETICGNTVSMSQKENCDANIPGFWQNPFITIKTQEEWNHCIFYS